MIFTGYQIADKANRWQAALDGDPEVNDPACFKRGAKSTAAVKFFYPGKTLTFATGVEIRGDVHFLDEYITGEDYGRDPMTMGTTWSSSAPVESEALAEAAVKDDYDVDISWRYQIPAPNGTDEWIDTGDTADLRYYLIWSDFACPAADFIDSRIAFLVDLAEGKTSSPDIADVLGPNLTGSARFGSNYWRGSDVWQILDYDHKGDCGTLATLMKYSLDLLGVPGSEVRFVFARHNNWTGLWNSSDDWHDNTVSEWRDPSDVSTLLGYVSGSWNYYEGCCFYAAKWWMGGFGESRSSAYDVLMRVTQPNTSGTGQHQAYADDESTPVSYPAGTP